jgi:hypothetical protein
MMHRVLWEVGTALAVLCLGLLADYYVAPPLTRALDHLHGQEHTSEPLSVLEAAEEVTRPPLPKPVEQVPHPPRPESPLPLPKSVEEVVHRCSASNGSSGVARLYLVAKDYNWQLSEDDRVEQLSKDLLPVLHNPGVRQRLQEADFLIALGTASCENGENPGQRAREERRSLDRARQLSRWIEETGITPQVGKETLVLPVGQYLTRECDQLADTSSQRRVAIAALQHPGTVDDLGTCLDELFTVRSEEPGFALPKSHYSLLSRCRPSQLLETETQHLDLPCAQASLPW